MRPSATHRDAVPTDAPRSAVGPVARRGPSTAGAGTWPRRIVGVDPGLNSTGLVALDFLAPGRAVLVAHRRARTNPRHTLTQRLGTLAGSFREFLDLVVFRRDEARLAFAIEDPTEWGMLTDRPRQFNTAARLGAAFGLLAGMAMVTPGAAVALVPVREWYFRDRGRFMRHDQVAAVLRRSLPVLAPLSEDEVFAGGVAWHVARSVP